MMIDAYFPYILAAYGVTFGLLAALAIHTIVQYRRSLRSMDETET